jgi:7-cyano-7-deazaguanine synthase
MKKTVLCFSGGMDSTVALATLKEEMGHEVICLGVHYGQRHERELMSAQNVARYYQSELVVSYVPPSLFKGSSQTSPEIDVPEGHYAEESMKKTVVPNRNMVLLSLATALAISRKADFVAYAAHTGDHAIYPDCRPEFAEAFRGILKHSDWNPPQLLTPFLPKFNKTDIAFRGATLKVPFHLTWSCYKGGEYHCGVCGTCQERKEAFRDAGVPDPTVYLTDHRKEE